MFSPPPSPHPLRPVQTPSTLVTTTTTPCRKLMTTRRLRWTVLLVPLILIFITASTKLIAHPVAFDLLAVSDTSWTQLTNWRLHRRHSNTDLPLPTPTQDNAPPPPSSSTIVPTSSAPTTTTTTTPLSLQPVPDIPTSPPPLPTPFPQPLEELTQNFSSVSCYNFFVNMTDTEPFRECRPLSLLIQSSDTFLEAQTNLTVLNTLIWGTCNTTLSADQCVQNMAWFVNQLKSQCTDDLAANNEYAVSTLIGLQAFSLMRDVGCLSDSSTNNGSYCYVTAVRNPNPSDLYFYSLPLGNPLPPTASPLCSSCTGSIMQRYADALQDPTQAALLTGLKATYNAAVTQADGECGSGYAQTVLLKSGGKARSWVYGGVTLNAKILLSAAVVWTWTLGTLLS